MTEEHKTYQVVVRQVAAGGSALEALLPQLQNGFGLDAYTCRQRLIGPGLALLGQEPRARAERIGVLLRRHGLSCWIVEAKRPRFNPDQLRSLEIFAGHVELICRKSSVRLSRGARVLAVLGDVSGELHARHLKRMIAQHAYRGHSLAAGLEGDELIRAIYRGRPVFDFYLQGDDGELLQGVRAIPAKFNHSGLGERASLGSIPNLDALRRLIEEYAGDYRLHTDFGLGFLPGCTVDGGARRRINPRQAPAGLSASAAGADTGAAKPAAIDDPLFSLTCYGWLVAQLKGDGRLVESACGQGAAAAITGPGQPALAARSAAEMTASSPELLELADELRQGEPALSSATGGQTVPRDLPPPPERPEARPPVWRILVPLAGFAGGAALILGDGAGLVGQAASYGLATGAVPAVAAVVLLWSGGYCLHLKRRIEDTPTSRVRSIAMGLVEVHGRVQRQYALVAPMTQVACAWYRLRKYRKDSRDKWKLVKDQDSSHVPFLVDDGSGQVLVDPRGASIKASVRQTGYPGQASPLTFTTVGSDFGKDEKWVEDLIYEGSSLYVLGFAQPRREGGGLSLAERTLARLRQLKLDPQAMRRYDTDGDGRLDEGEWAAARADVEQATLGEHLAERRERKRQEEHVVIARPPQPSLPFIIADVVSEVQLAEKYGWLSVPLLLTGIAASVLALYKLALYLRL